MRDGIPTKQMAQYYATYAYWRLAIDLLANLKTTLELNQNLDTEDRD